MLSKGLYGQLVLKQRSLFERGSGGPLVDLNYCRHNDPWSTLAANSHSYFRLSLSIPDNILSSSTYCSPLSFARRRAHWLLIIEVYRHGAILCRPTLPNAVTTARSSSERKWWFRCNLDLLSLGLIHQKNFRLKSQLNISLRTPRIQILGSDVFHPSSNVLSPEAASPGSGGCTSFPFKLGVIT